MSDDMTLLGPKRVHVSTTSALLAALRDGDHTIAPDTDLPDLKKMAQKASEGQEPHSAATIAQARQRAEWIITQTLIDFERATGAQITGVEIDYQQVASGVKMAPRVAVDVDIPR